MSIKTHKPTTPGRRKSSGHDFSGLSRVKPMKSLLVTRKRMGGRNAQGKITVRHHGGGHKRMIRLIDWNPASDSKQAEVKTIEYDPNRSARIALIAYPDGTRKYILASDGLKPGQKITVSPEKIDVQVGNRLKLEFIPAGTAIHNLELEPGKGGKIVRSAGSSAVLMSQEGEFAQVKMPSSEIRIFSKNCMATIGQVSNPDHRNVRLGKAGRMRWLGVRPTVRGKVMNPVDHPHGGGEGRNPIGLKQPKTAQGKRAMGVKTRSHTKKSAKFILKRRPTRKQ
ncbi:MAG: 50S ribosomal protein L2 [Candidatus Kerfeldbacteria bacterium RIFCSPHIGHO2_12_FULL_48_17]|uniref:Large ribosomal subunit protein uL2 n=1 Tax=Candidatus Kerfeldbacteria bacterium RIFCSPHIGHO2_12_FULL_48_17 TaxID=1798542 RepID=A0A1G2B7K6_9BACT|nr:MAG: 50S ribosomal protein L2 [Candidatus Kerfeldbacteria bacterium RIFCSPHIGHO2_12_FULL_48_17]